MLQQSIICLIAALAIQVDSAPDCDLKSIFRTPARRNYDQLEILERSNFDQDDQTTTSSNLLEKPKSFANAQVMLRFGGGDLRRCACGSTCPCRCPPPLQPCCYSAPIVHPPTPHIPQPMPQIPHPGCSHINPPVPQVPQPVIPQFSRPVIPQIPHSGCTHIPQPAIPQIPQPALPQIPQPSPPHILPVPQSQCFCVPQFQSPYIPYFPSQSSTVYSLSQPIAESGILDPYQSINQVTQVQSTNVIQQAPQQSANVIQQAPQVVSTNVVQQNVAATTTKEAPQAVTNNVVQQNVVSEAPKVVNTNVVQQNVVNDAPQAVSKKIVQQNVEIKNNNHPQILGTVTYPDSAIEGASQLTISNDQIEEDINQLNSEELIARPEIINKIEPTLVSPNLKFVNVDLDDLTGRRGCDLDQPQGKLLVFRRPQDGIIPPQPRAPIVRGYRVSSASGFYSEPGKTVVYRKPTVLSVLCPQNLTPVPQPRPQKQKEVFVCFPVNTVRAPPRPHPIGCGCGCPRYLGELNERVF